MKGFLIVPESHSLVGQCFNFFSFPQLIRQIHHNNEKLDNNEGPGLLGNNKQPHSFGNLARLEGKEQCRNDHIEKDMECETSN